MTQKTLYITILAFCFFSFTLEVNSQPSITWNKIYNPSISYDEAYAICSAGNGFYFVGGRAHDINFGDWGYLMKINEYGDTIWSKYIYGTFDIFVIVPTPDNGCIFSGGRDSLVTFRLDSNGNSVWAKAFTDDFCIIYDIKRTSDGKYIACGKRSLQNDGIIFKFDINGTLEWLHIYPPGNKWLRSVEEVSNNGFIVTGTNIDRIVLLRIDGSGNIIWEKEHKIFNRTSWGEYIKKTNSGYFIAGGTFDTANVTEKKRVSFIRTDTSGNVIFSHFFPYYRDDSYSTAHCINENRFVFSSYAYSQILPNDTSANVVRITDSMGNILASKNFYSQYGNDFYAIHPVQNGDLIFGGYIDVSGDAILICRTDSMLQGPPISIKTISSQVPRHYMLYQNYPNPFNPTTNIKYQIVNNKSDVRISVFDVTGKHVIDLVNGQQNAGTYEVDFNGSDLASGIYFYSLIIDSKHFDTKKMILVK